MGIYRSPKVTKNNYHILWKSNTGNLFLDITSEKVYSYMGDMNLNELIPGDKEEKILEYQIKESTRITETSSTLLDVIQQTNKNFLEKAIYNPEISDHHMVYASLKERAVQHKTRTLKVCSYKNFSEEKFEEDLEMAAWHVGECFESVDDQ